MWACFGVSADLVASTWFRLALGASTGPRASKLLLVGSHGSDHSDLQKHPQTEFLCCLGLTGCDPGFLTDLSTAGGSSMNRGAACMYGMLEAWNMYNASAWEASRVEDRAVYGMGGHDGC